MRVALISDGFTEKMGYSDTLLSKTLAALGADVHVITSDLTLNLREDATLVSRWLGDKTELAPREVNGCTVHTLRHRFRKEGVFMNGLQALLAELKPDVVQTQIVTSWSTWQAYACRARVGFKFFLEEHTHWSVFALHPAWKREAYRLLYGRMIGPWLDQHLEKDYCLGADCRRIAVEYYGISPDKAVLTTHGSDTDTFHPSHTEAERQAAAALRVRLGIEPDEVVFLYTGRFTQGKNPFLLAQAVAGLRAEGLRCRALFVGWGEDAAVARLRAADGCVVHPFVEWWQLADFYRAADVAVWPREESLSQLDAVASGLPLVLNHQVGTPERAQGNGRLYTDFDLADLMRVLRELMDAPLRRELGAAGVQKIHAHFAWRTLAAERLRDYESACMRTSPR